MDTPHTPPTSSDAPRVHTLLNTDLLADQWIDADTTPEADTTDTFLSRLASHLAPAVRLPAKLWSFLHTTPGRLSAVSLILILAIAAAGGALWHTSDTHHNKLDNLIRNTEPLANASQTLFGSLSVADATATIGFLQGGAGNAADDSRYAAAIADATSALIQAGAGTDTSDVEVLPLVTEVNQKLAVYTGLIAQAKANNRQGNPVGAAYLTEASSIMQEDILPAAAKLNDITSARVRTQERTLTQPLWFPASGLLAAVVMLLLAQVWLAARTNRRLNVGLATSTVAMTVALVWLVVSSVVTLSSQEAHFSRSAFPLYDISQARIQAQQARTGEAIMLVRRTNQSSTAAFDWTADQIATQLRQVPLSAANEPLRDQGLAALQGWQASHTAMVERVAAGEYGAAVKVAVGQDSAQLNSQAQFSTLDQVLLDIISQKRLSLRSFLEDNQRATEQITQIVLVLSVVAVAGVALGMRPRIREYR